MSSHVKWFTFLLTVILVQGCTTTYMAVGKFDDYKEIFVGKIDADLSSGKGTIVAETINSEIRCEGYSYVTYIPPSLVSCAGQRGKAPMTCSDGRKMTVDWVATSCTTGVGSGQDQHGATFNLVFGLDENEARNELEKVAQDVADKPEFPVYRPKEFRKEKGFSTGTGFFVSNDGYLVTNHHVIDGAKEIFVVSTIDGTEFSAELVLSDPVNDVAILKVNGATVGIPVVPGFNGNKGEEVMTLGYPLLALQGQEQKATFGRINALSGIQGDIRFIQIDVPIQPGNSGGPLLNNKGEVIGVVTQTLDQIVTLKASGALPQNVNYAVKVDYLLPALRAAKVRQSQVGSSAVKMDMAQIVAQRESSVMLVIAK